MKPFERGIGARVFVAFGRKPGQAGMMVGATIVAIKPKRVVVKRDNEQQLITKKWSELH